MGFYDEKSIYGLCGRFIDNYYSKKNIRVPNSETVKAMNDSDNDIDMIKCEDAQDMFNKLGLD